MSRGRIIALLLLVVFVAGASFWFIRRNRRPPPGEPAESLDKFGKELDIKTLLGTLSFKPTIEEGTNSSRYWLYVDGRIVATKSSPQSDSTSLNAIDILLVPGEYNVEVGVTQPESQDSGSSFPFAFRSQRVRIEAGEVENLPLSVEAAKYDELTALSPSLHRAGNGLISGSRQWKTSSSRFKKIRRTLPFSKSLMRCNNHLP